jgi:hypothetical protein
MCWFIIGGGLISGRSMSSPVNTATTPGAERAALVSMARILACATGERTKNTW